MAERNLLVVRHAKSSWRVDGLTDHQRPLNDRGNRDGPRMAAHLAEQAPRPDWVLVSDAVRTRETVAHLAEGLGLDAATIHFDHRLYLASVGTLFDVAAEAPSDVTTLMLVAHNNGVTDFVNSLAGQVVTDNVPTLGVAWFRLQIDAWHRLRPGLGAPAAFWVPKGI